MKKDQVPYPNNLWEFFKHVLKLLSEHGIARILVAVGIVVPIYFLIRIPSESLLVNSLLLAGAALMIITGALVRVFEMKYKLFSGRTVLLRCSNPDCRKPIKESFKIEGKTPPEVIKCDSCDSIHILQ